ncbi:hypothetical protein ABZP36_020251 [Zizania latifolia]
MEWTVVEGMHSTGFIIGTSCIRPSDSCIKELYFCSLTSIFFSFFLIKTASSSFNHDILTTLKISHWSRCPLVSSYLLRFILGTIRISVPTCTLPRWPCWL